MKSNKIVLVILLAFSLNPLTVKSQNIQLDNLLSYNQLNIGTIEESFILKGWEFESANDNGTDSLSDLTLFFKSSNKTIARISFMYNQKHDYKSLLLQLTEISEYKRLITQLNEKGFILKESKIINNDFIKFYKKGNQVIELRSTKAINSDKSRSDSNLYYLSIEFYR